MTTKPETITIDKAQYDAAMKVMADKQKAKDKEKRYWAKQAILVRKAVEAGFTVSEAELVEYVSKMKTRSK